MGSYQRGMSDEKKRQEIQARGCTSGESQRLLELIARETDGPYRGGQAVLNCRGTAGVI